MEYYIISLIVSIIIFLFIYNKNKGNEYENSIMNNPPESKILSMKNILLFFIIYIVSTILSFYIFTSSLSISSLCPVFLLNLLTIPPTANIDNNIQNYKELYNDEIDPKILSKINDSIDIGFEPNYEEYKND